MPFRSSKGQDPSVQNLVRTQGSSKLGETIGGGGGGEVIPKSFYATGGTMSDPGDGYIYHNLPSVTGFTAEVFEVVQLNSEPEKNVIEIMLGGAGGGGGGGGNTDSSGATPGSGGTGGAVGAWQIPVTLGTYDQTIGSGGLAPFGPNGVGQGGPGGGGPGAPGNQSWFRASGDPSRQLTTPGGVGGFAGNPNPNPPVPPTPGSTVAISWTWAGGTITDNLPSPPTGEMGGSSGGGNAPPTRWWRPISSGGGSGGPSGNGRSNPNNEGGWRNPGISGNNGGSVLIRYPKVATYQPGIPGVSD